MSSQTRNESTQKWFGVKTLYQLEEKSVTPGLHCYEERITIWKAESFEEAIEMASLEAQEYAENHHGMYLGFCQAFEMYNDPQDGAEVYSIMREDDREPETYIDGMYDTGREYSIKEPVEA